MAKSDKIIGVILAGGRSSRMRGTDKATARLGDVRIVDQVHQRVLEQVAEVIISGADDYGLALPCVPDALPGYQGPLAGLHGALLWAVAHRPGAAGILSVPVDAPFLPQDLLTRLTARATVLDTPAIAETHDGLQPAFGYWPLATLPLLEAHLAQGEAGALRHFAVKAGARHVQFGSADAFTNINTPEDLDAAQRQLRGEVA